MSSNITVTHAPQSELQGTEVSKLLPAILYTSLMMILGASGNALVCYIYGFRWQSTVTKTFISFLATLDLINCLLCMPTEVAMLVKIVTFDAPVWCKISRFLTYTLNGSSSLILVSIALDRWYKVCHPLKYFFTSRRAQLTCLCSLILAAFVSWPSLLLYGNLTVPVAATSQLGIMCLVSDDYIDTWWPLMFYCVYFSCYLVLVGVITVLYSLLALRLVKLRKKQKERLAAKYSGFRLSAVESPSHQMVLLANNNTCQPVGVAGKSGMKIQVINEEAEILEEEHIQSPLAAIEVAPQFQRIQEENSRRRSITFRLPGQHAASVKRHSLHPSDDTRSADARSEMANGEITGLNVPEKEELLRECIVQDRSSKCAEASDIAGDCDQNKGEDGTLTGGEADLSDFSRAKPAKLLQRIDSPTDSQGEDTTEFEHGIHFASHADIQWQHNPIVDSAGVMNCRNGGINVPSGGMHLENNIKDASDRTNAEMQDTESDCLLCSPLKETESGKSQAGSETISAPGFISDRKGSSSVRNSFLEMPERYPGGHTPTSRLPSPAGTPSLGDADNHHPVRLSNALILERLRRKSAYRPAKTTRMLFAISIVFIGSFLPFFCVVIVRALLGKVFLTSLTDTGFVLINILIRSTFISNAANPIIYGLCNKQFRTECSRLIGRCCEKEHGVTLGVIEQTDDVLGANNSV